MQTDPVRSIRMAAALNQRYGALLRTKTGDSIDAMELKIGEMNQIYPEIWRYLDEARGALAARGLEVGEFDQLRATEHAGTLGTESIEVEERFNALGLVTSLAGPAWEQTKTVTYNVEGHHKALAAVRSLQRALPDVDWVALDRAEQQEIAAAGSLTAGNWKKLAISAAIVLALLGVVVGAYKVIMNHDPDPDATAAREKADAERRATAKAEGQARVEKLQHELATRPCDPVLSNKLYQTYLGIGRTHEARVFKSEYETTCKQGAGSARR